MNNKINNKHFYMIFDNGHIVHVENRSNRLVRYFRHLFNLRSNLKLTSFVRRNLTLIKKSRNYLIYYTEIAI